MVDGDLPARASRPLAPSPAGFALRPLPVRRPLREAEVGANVCSPVLHDGHLYWISDRNQTAYCLNAKDGSVVYEEKVDVQPYASALFADGRLYVPMRNSGTLVLAAQPTFKKLAHNRLKDRSIFDASPIVNGGKLILRSNHNLYCFSR